MMPDEIEENLNRIFASRLKTVSKQNLQIWVNEIAKYGFYDEAITIGTNQIVNDESVALTLPAVMGIFKEENRKIKSKLPKPEKNCKYCKGLNWVYTTMLFKNDGRFVNINYALRCYHNHRETNDTQMILNEETNNKTPYKNGYFLIFEDVWKRNEYFEKVMANGKYDLWVNPDEIKGEEE